MKPEGYVPQFFQPITSAIPFFYRWKIMQAKLLLNDLKYLNEKHQIQAAADLYFTIQGEIERLLDKIDMLIQDKRLRRKFYEQKEEAVQRNK